jgi:hypothetical protein
MPFKDIEAQRLYAREWRLAHPGYARVHNEKWRRENPVADQESQARYRAKKFYGLSPKEYSDLLLSASEHCMLCGEKQTDILHVDHDHISGKVRGLLCRGCNTGLGGFKDDPELLEKAILYLRTSR